ncbi:MAG TPA: Calx-beta domain-containing protein [Thermoanaerobaculia bacterium]|nr:Calx-beta domain-containing protein [Thermoanaerobaculia bacterium]
MFIRRFLLAIALSLAASMAADDVCPRTAPDGVLVISTRSMFSGGFAGSYPVYRPNQPISFTVDGFLCVNCIGPLYSIQPCDKLTWHFGDGTSLVTFGRTPATHIYMPPGDWNYTVTVTVENSLGTAKASTPIIVAEGAAALLRIETVQVQEADQTVWVPVIRTGNLQSHVTALYRIFMPSGEHPSGTLDFPPGIDRTWIPVQVFDDDVAESYETPISILLTDLAGGAGIEFGAKVGVIVKDDEPYPTATFADVEVLESAGVARIPVTLDVPLRDPSYYSFSINGGVTRSGSFPALQKTSFIEIPIVDDARPEPDETILVSFRAENRGSDEFPRLQHRVVRITILDDDGDSPRRRSARH